jgi:hypothetical protein
MSPRSFFMSMSRACSLLALLLTAAITGCGDDDGDTADDDDTPLDASADDDVDAGADVDAAAEQADAAAPDGGVDPASAAGAIELYGVDLGVEPLIGFADARFWSQVVPHGDAAYGPLDVLQAFPAFDTCLTGDVLYAPPPWDATSLDVGVFVKLFEGDVEILLDRIETDGLIEYHAPDDLEGEVFLPGAAYDVEIGEELWTDAVPLPARPTITSAGWAEGLVSTTQGQDLAITWEPAGLDYVELEFFPEGGDLALSVICRVTDDGEFAVPAAMLDVMPRGASGQVNFAAADTTVQMLDGRPVLIRAFYYYLANLELLPLPR